MSHMTISIVNALLAFAVIFELAVLWPHATRMGRNQAMLVLPLAISLLFLAMQVADWSGWLSQYRQTTGWHLFDLLVLSGYLVILLKQNGVRE